MTFSTFASPGVSLQGGGGSGGGGTPGGSDTQIQYNNAGAFAGASGLTTNGTELTIASGAKTADAPVLNMSQTWNNGAVTFTGLKFNAAGTSDANSAAASLLMDLQVGGTSRFKVAKGGAITATGFSNFGSNVTGAGQFIGGAYTSDGISTIGISLAWNSNSTFGVASGGIIGFTSSATDSRGLPDALISRRGAANLRLGAADTTGTTAPTPQFLSAQSWLSSTTNNQTGANFTIDGSQGTGTGAGGSIIFRVAPAGGTSNGVQNGLSAALTITGLGITQFRSGAVNAPSIMFGTASPGPGGIGIWQRANGRITISDTNSVNLFEFGNISGSGFLGVNSTGLIGFCSGDAGSTAQDVCLNRDAANTLALRNANDGQTFRLYGRFTDITNDFERFFINAPTTSGAAVLLGTQKGATTGTARALEFQTDGTTRLTIAAIGAATFSSQVKTNLYFDAPAASLGGNGGIYFGVTGTGAQIQATAVGVLALANYAGTDFSRLQFGGTSSAFPALKRVSANLQVIAADGTSSAGMIVGNQALATTATDGFLYVPTCAGTPTGTPTTQTGTVPIVVDTTNNKLYFYSNAAWRDAGP